MPTTYYQCLQSATQHRVNRAKTLTKDYTLTLEELVVLREALKDYKQFIEPGADSSIQRQGNYALCRVLLEQITADIRTL